MATRHSFSQMYVPRRIELATKIFINLPIFVRKCLSKQYRSTCWFIFSDPTSLETSGLESKAKHLTQEFMQILPLVVNSMVIVFDVFFKILLKVHSLPINEYSAVLDPRGTYLSPCENRSWQNCHIDSMLVAPPPGPSLSTKYGVLKCQKGEVDCQLPYLLGWGGVEFALLPLFGCSLKCPWL